MNKKMDKVSKQGRLRLGKIHHISIAVKDVEKTARNFSEILDIGQFKIGLFESPSDKATLYGQSQGWMIKGGNIRIGPICIELQQTLKGRTVSDDFIKERGVGIHHLAFECEPPIDDEIEKWKKNGINAIQVDKSFEDKKYGWAFMDTEKLFGFVLELLCLPPDKRDI